MTVYEHLGYTRGQIEYVVLNLPRYYITYKILKRSGKTRRIDAPQNPLKNIQKDILQKILYMYRAHPIAHGFVKDKSPITNATIHVGKRFLVAIDLKNFFNSIHERRVSLTLEWLFQHQQTFTWGPEDCVLLSKILCYNGGLPQGSPASPVMSNLVCLGLDKRLAALAAANDVTITRYADDIAMSSNDKKVLDLRFAVYEQVQRFGLIVNRAKTKLRHHFQRQQVTGVVVNQQLGTRKEMWKNIRARLHNLQHAGNSLTPKEYQQVRGQIEWVRSLNPHRGDQLIDQLLVVNVKP